MGAPTRTDILDDLYTTTWQIRKPGIVDNIFLATPFWKMMTTKGRMYSQIGGKWVEVNLRYGKNETVTSFGKGDTISINETDKLTVATWNWKYVAGSVIRYFVDEQRNQGKAQIINWVKDKLDNLESSLIDTFETMLFGDGTGNGGKDIDGLDNIIAEDPTTGTVGGINAATFAWWRNQTTDLSAKDVSIYLRPAMNTMFNKCGQQGEGVSRFPNLIVTDQTVYETYESELVEIKQIVNSNVGDLGFGDLVFKGRPMTWSPSAKAGNMYFINTEFLQWMYDPNYYFEMDDWKPIVNQPKDRVTQVVVTGNLVCSNRRRQGVIFDIGDAA